MLFELNGYELKWIDLHTSNIEITLKASARPQRMSFGYYSQNVHFFLIYYWLRNDIIANFDVGSMAVAVVVFLLLVMNRHVLSTLYWKCHCSRIYEKKFTKTTSETSVDDHLYKRTICTQQPSFIDEWIAHTTTQTLRHVRQSTEIYQI